MSHQNHIEGHIHVDCKYSGGAAFYSSCECCNSFLDSVKQNIYELQESASKQGLCRGCGSDWCAGGCDDE